MCDIDIRLQIDGLLLVTTILSSFFNAQKSRQELCLPIYRQFISFEIRKIRPKYLATVLLK